MIIFRYLLKEVYGTLLATTGVLLLLLISNQFVHYLSRAAAGNMPPHTVLQLMMLQMPLLLGLLLPLGLFLGVLMAYGRLYADREMTVLSACGFSRAQLLVQTFFISLIISIVVAMLVFWVQPKMEWFKRRIIADAASSSPIERIFPAQFISIDKLVLYVDDVSVDHKELKKVFVAQRGPNRMGEGRAWEIVSADSGYQWLDPETHDRFIVLQNGYRYSGVPGQRDYQVIKYDKYGVRIERNAIPMENRIETLATTDLFKKLTNNPSAQAELQWRISLPLSIFILAFLALPLSYVKPRQGRYAQLVPAFILYLIYADLLFVARAWVQKGHVSPIIGMWWVHALMLVIALLLWARFIGWKRTKSFLTHSQRTHYENT